ncbi:hypothetical protein G3V73_23870, partial [Escherichia coli]|nr:hypothetical protein [Escherichia coli]
SYVYPSPDLRNYVKILRKIEREPAEAPQTSAAIRALERARRNRGKSFLETSRVKLIESNEKKQKLMSEQKKQIEKLAEINGEGTAPQSITAEIPEKTSQNGRPLFQNASWKTPENEEKAKEAESNGNGKNAKNDPFANRQPITEVLRDIYDT